jgi:hypothetical protein
MTRRNAPRTTPQRKPDAPTPRQIRYYYVTDLCSGLIVSYVGTSNCAAIQMRKEIKRAHPHMLLIVAVRRATPHNLRAIRALPTLRLDKYPEAPDYTN